MPSVSPVAGPPARVVTANVIARDGKGSDDGEGEGDDEGTAVPVALGDTKNMDAEYAVAGFTRPPNDGLPKMLTGTQAPSRAIAATAMKAPGWPVREPVPEQPYGGSDELKNSIVTASPTICAE